MPRRKKKHPRHIYILVAGFVILSIFVFIKDKIEPPQPAAPLETVEDNNQSQKKPHNTLQEKITPYEGPLSASIFVPYWLLPSSEALPPQNLDAELDTLIYFGITPTETGINTSEPGYNHLGAFTSLPQANKHETLLTVRMINEDINRTIFESSTAQKKVIEDSLKTAKEYGFDGIVLDLEHSVLPTDEVVADISAFIENFSSEVKGQKMIFSVALYGDTFYRARPYDVQSIAAHADRIYIMAYDLHKSFGEPGPNFPLDTDPDAEYPYYTFKRMLQSFQEKASTHQISIIYGMYGYDWMVDEKERPAKAASARTYNQIKASFFPECTYSRCKVDKDAFTSETHISFYDESGQKHSLWYEDLDSVKAKSDYARTQGISQVSFWAHGYY